MKGSGHLISSAVVTLFVIGAASQAFAAGNGPSQKNEPQARPPKAEAENGHTHILPVQGNVYMLVGDAANITVQIGKNAVVIVDSGLADLSDELVSQVQKLTNRPIEFIINTSADADHTGGNQNVSKQGWFLPVVTANNPERNGASIVAHINVLNRMSAPTGKQPPVSEALWPTDTYDTDEWQLFNNEPIIIEHPHAAHSDGDSFVFFRRSDVISTGDIFTPLKYPLISPQKGGSVNGTIDALNRIIDILVPEENEEGGTYVIPGHGRLCDRTDVVDYRDMLTIIRDRIQALVNKGMNLEEVKAARPTFDYDVIYGSDSGTWTTEMFVEAVYQELKKMPGQGHASKETR